jgi:hypothetical protein
LPQLNNLIDPDPILVEYPSKENSVDDFYKNLHNTKGKSTVVPVLIQPNGGIVYLNINCTLGFYKRYKIFLLQQFYPLIKADKTIEFVNNIKRGKGVIRARISGKVRNYPVVFWDK